MNPEADFIALLEYKKTEEGGRTSYALSGYRPSIKFPFSEMLTSGIQNFIDKEKVFPGEIVKVEINILSPEYFKYQLCENLEFDFREGSKIIGTGKIISISNPKLKSKKIPLLDSRMIYETNKAYQNKIKWLKQSPESESEWMYINFDNTDYENCIHEIIVRYFNSEILFVSINRNDSFQTDRMTTIAKIKTYLKTHNFSIWDKDFSKIIEFNKIGILRKGSR
ncbi:hypothetical protein NHF50_15225 [Flavobacterium sp. NRK F10]|uniref:hypothetical protein n=1 Tax=Flavobacterium sp. NRK F10 TaxID=2954931 RepID=UPI002090DCF8|nr:hypothetical protein [Flavobacterium sp. NRK F10]MCO6176400.1 hypothetical protein [Flavobacterium sp. NRK F10]